MQISDNQCCFICGPHNPAGMRVRPSYDWAAGRAWLTVVIADHYQGWEGVAHGGVVAALLDELSVYAGMGESRRVVTAELTVRYLKPVPIGKDVFIEATLRERAGRSVMVDARLSCDGVVLATSSARLVVLRPAPA